MIRAALSTAVAGSLLVSAALLLAPGAAAAADAEGLFAIKGAGRRTCTDFATTHAARGPDWALYGGWLEGYVTGFNERQDGVYDVTPWQTTELMLGLLAQYCAAKPDARFIDAANLLLRRLAPLRAATAPELETLTAGDQAMYVYRSVMVQAQERLRALGHYDGPADGRPTPAFSAGLAAFQTAVGIPQSRLPDQRTLFELLLRDQP